MVAGPVGSGKTTLANAILGEVPFVAGSISVSSTRIGYCQQSPWLPSGTIKEVICGFLREDPGWYEQVVRLCCLHEDILSFPKGDQTMIGSRGLNLSGGQRQRVVSRILLLELNM
jgi:ATP-binding cassette, subfamily C (CFTR/MRP), member 1